MWAGVSKSGSPRSRWMIRSPAASRCAAAAMTRPSSEVECRTARSAINRGMCGLHVRGSAAKVSRARLGAFVHSRSGNRVPQSPCVLHSPIGHGRCLAGADPNPARTASGERTMARIHLRDVCDHLSASTDVEGIVDALLAYLRAYQGDWHPTLAMVDGQHDAITRVWSRERGRMDRRDLVLPVDHLPARLVRKFFRPSAFFNATERRSLLSKVFRATPVYEPDRFETAQLEPLAAPVPWHSCIVLPLADQDDLLALLVLVSPRRGAFPAATVEEVLAIRTMAAVALARRMHSEGRQTPEARQAEEQSRRAQGMFQERLRQLECECTTLAEESRQKSERTELLAREIERIQTVALHERAELDTLRHQTRALDEQASTAAAHLTDAYTQLAATQQRLNDQREARGFTRG